MEFFGFKQFKPFKPLERSVAVELSGQKLRRRRISLGLRLNELNMFNEEVSRG
jgi:hypothetical protein